MNNATLNFRVDIVFRFFEYIPRSGIAGSSDTTYVLLSEEVLDCSPK